VREHPAAVSKMMLNGAPKTTRGITERIVKKEKGKGKAWFLGLPRTEIEKRGVGKLKKITCFTDAHAKKLCGIHVRHRLATRLGGEREGTTGRRGKSLSQSSRRGEACWGAGQW